MTTPVVRCAIYTRKSTEDGLDQAFNSLDAQREACAAYIKSQASEGWRIDPARFDDGGFSGGDMNRPALSRLIEEIEAHRVQVIVVYKIDRLTRSLADFARLVEVLDQHGASFVSVTQQFNTTTSMGRLTLNVLLSFAQFEREVTSERIRDKVAASKRKGMWMGGRPPLGYDVKDRKLAVNKREAPIVRLIFEHFLEESSLTRLESRLKRDGVNQKRWVTQTGKPAGGAALTRTSLARMLRNPIYIGKIRQGGDLFDGEQDAIIDESLFDRVQQALGDAAEAKRPARNGKASAILSGLIYDNVGNRMAPSHARKGERQYRYYVSLPLIRGDKKKVGDVARVNAVLIEDFAHALIDREKLAPSDSLGANRLAAIEKIILHRDDVETILKDGRTIRTPIHLAAEKSAIRIIDGPRANNRNEALIKAVALGFAWRQKLEMGEHPSAAAIGKLSDYTERYVQKILRLGFLAPDIVEAILEGRQPASLTLHDLNKTAFTGDWRSQRRALGF